jgi:hypothetical protein
LTAQTYDSNKKAEKQEKLDGLTFSNQFFNLHSVIGKVSLTHLACHELDTAQPQLVYPII